MRVMFPAALAWDTTTLPERGRYRFSSLAPLEYGRQPRGGNKDVPSIAPGRNTINQILGAQQARRVKIKNGYLSRYLSNILAMRSVM